MHILGDIFYIQKGGHQSQDNSLAKSEHWTAD